MVCFFIGLTVGGCLGVFLMGLFAAGKEEDLSKNSKNAPIFYKWEMNC